MPVEVQLIKLVAIPDSRPAWPEEFTALIQTLEKSLGDRTVWGGVADWCDERGEGELADAFRWVSRHTTVNVITTSSSIGNYPYTKNVPTWYISNKPDSLQFDPDFDDRRSIPGLMAALAKALAVSRKKAKKALGELNTSLGELS